MHHQPDFERDQDRERREGFRGGRDDGRFEQRGQERMEPEELRHRGRARDYGDEGYARSQPGGGQAQHQQYSQTYGGQGQYGGQDRYGGQGQYGGYQERYGGQGQYGGNSEHYGGYQERYGGQGQYGGNSEHYGGYQERYGNQGQYGSNPEHYGGYQERYGNQGQGRFGGNEHGSRMGSMTGPGGGRSFEAGRSTERGRNQFRGKGPKDWTRSDERIREDVCEQLADSDDVDASDITVKVENGEVTLEGSVDSRWAKREVEEIACGARGVKDCQNHLRVKSETTSTGKEKETGNGHTQTSRSSSSMSNRPTA